MAKKVFLNKEKEIEIIFNTKIEEKELGEMLELATKYIKENKKIGIPINLLVNVSKVKGITTGARKYGSNWLLKSPIDKVAVYSGSLFMKYFLPMLINGIGYHDKMKHFETKAEAKEWLNSN